MVEGLQEQIDKLGRLWACRLVGQLWACHLVGLIMSMSFSKLCIGIRKKTYWFSLSLKGCYEPWNTQCKYIAHTTDKHRLLIREQVPLWSALQIDRQTSPWERMSSPFVVHTYYLTLWTLMYTINPPSPPIWRRKFPS